MCNKIQRICMSKNLILSKNHKNWFESKKSDVLKKNLSSNMLKGKKLAWIIVQIILYIFSNKQKLIWTGFKSYSKAYNKLFQYTLIKKEEVVLRVGFTWSKNNSIQFRPTSHKEQSAASHRLVYSILTSFNWICNK